MLENKKTSKYSLTILVIISLILGAIIYNLGHFFEETNNVPQIEYKTQIQAPVYSGKVLEGVASFYDYYLEEYDWSSIGHFVCATRDFERYSYVEVTNLDNGFMVKCLVTDHGPNKEIHPDRIIDLSSTSFKALGNIKLGLLNVRVKQLTERK
jgi:rare lipoprotein A